MSNNDNNWEHEVVTRQERLELEQWARDNFVPGADIINDDWHPIIKEECKVMEKELLREDSDIVKQTLDD